MFDHFQYIPAHSGCPGRKTVVVLLLLLTKLMIFCILRFSDKGKISGSSRLWDSHCQEQDSSSEWPSARDASLSTRRCLG